MNGPSFELEIKPGLPPSKAIHTWYGWTKDWNPFTIYWNKELGCWFAVGFNPGHEDERSPILMVLLRDKFHDFIVWHAAAPLVGVGPE